MRLKIIATLGFASFCVNASTSSSIANYSLPHEAHPIVDSSGIPIPAENSTVQFGTFTDAFAATLRDLDPRTQTPNVITAFIPSGSIGGFSTDGIFGILLPTDETGALGDAETDNGAYALVIWSPPDGLVQALVIDMGQKFPKHEGAEFSLTMDGIINENDIAFGGQRSLADTSSLPLPFRAFTEGISIEPWAVYSGTPILNITHNEGSATLSWQGYTGFRYRIEYSDDLENWFSELPGSTFSTDPYSNILTVSDHSPPARRYYRLVQNYR